MPYAAKLEKKEKRERRGRYYNPFSRFYYAVKQLAVFKI
jgi:hypothetical protein